MLTLVEYGLLLYRAFLPAPVWYRFFLNKEYGGLFSSFITGLYLTFKLTSLVEKVYDRKVVLFFVSLELWNIKMWLLHFSNTRCAWWCKAHIAQLFMLYMSELINFFYCPLQVRSFYAALKALSRKEMHYGSYATLEQVWQLRHSVVCTLW